MRSTAAPERAGERPNRTPLTDDARSVQPAKVVVGHGIQLPEVFRRTPDPRPRRRQRLVALQDIEHSEDEHHVLAPLGVGSADRPFDQDASVRRQAHTHRHGARSMRERHRVRLHEVERVEVADQARRRHRGRQHTSPPDDPKRRAEGGLLHGLDVEAHDRSRDRHLHLVDAGHHPVGFLSVPGGGPVAVVRHIPRPWVLEVLRDGQGRQSVGSATINIASLQTSQRPSLTLCSVSASCSVADAIADCTRLSGTKQSANLEYAVTAASFVSKPPTLSV